MMPFDADGPAGKALRSAVAARLPDFLPDYADDGVLPLYVTVLASKGGGRPDMATELNEFLGDRAGEFADW
jgi:hypothetical protein